jgi:hypothetical protein
MAEENKDKNKDKYSKLFNRVHFTVLWLILLLVFFTVIFCVFLGLTEALPTRKVGNIDVNKSLIISDGDTRNQATSINTDVELNTNSGMINTFSATISTGDVEKFKVKNNIVKENDIINLSSRSSNEILPYVSDITNGSFSINLYNRSGSGVTASHKINFVVIKGIGKYPFL